MNQDSEKQQSTSPEIVGDESANAQEVTIDEQKLTMFIGGLKQEQNISMAVIAGLGACIIGAVIWAVVTVSTGYQIGYMAIGVGFLVGFAIRYFGKGIDKTFGIIGAVMALLGCLLGNYLSIVGFIAQAEGLPYFETLGLIDMSLVPQIMIDTFNPMDVLFYGIAVYEGYKFSFRKITEEELIAHAAN